MPPPARVDKARLAKNLKVAREAAGISQSKAAEAVSKSRQTIVNWESPSATPEPDEAELGILAALYRVTARDLRYEEVTRGVHIEGHAPTVEIAPAKRGAELAASVRGGAHVSGDLTTVPRHARNLPLAVREYLAEFQLRLVRGGALEEEIDEAMALLRSPDVFSYFKGGKLAEYNEDDVLDGMRSLAEDVVIPRLQKLGRKVK